MIQEKINKISKKQSMPKCPTGIQGLDEITDGGLPLGRPTLICGGTGCGKTLMGMEFLFRGATEYGEPGVFICFEENAEELVQNVTSFGWNLQQLIEEKKLAIDHIYIDPKQIQEAGDYNLEGLFIRIALLVDTIGAKRIVLDTIEVLFAGLSNVSIVRAELHRLFHWLKQKGLTAIITGERGDNTLTRQGLEEYVSDCVIKLDQRTNEELAIRRLQIIKYRGSQHGSNEYPFLITEDGISVLPITSVGLDHAVSTEHISSGIPRLDTMLAGQGYFRGSSILITGTAGTGKSSFACHFAAEICRQGERCLYLASEEAPQQIIRNMRSIGLDLAPYVQQGLLNLQSVRPTAYGLEMHLVNLHHLLKEFKPSTVIIDAMSNLVFSGTLNQTHLFFIRLIDLLKSSQITMLLTNLIPGSGPFEQTQIGVSSLMDTWIELRIQDSNGERNRLLYVLKSRGMQHSNQVREFLLTKKGIELLDVYLGRGDVLTGSARIIQEAQEKLAVSQRQLLIDQKRRELERKEMAVSSQISSLQAELAVGKEEIRILTEQESLFQSNLKQGSQILSQSRKAD
ncbi:circadian clock protein KaiC [Dolichospermum sp. ST_sed3]|nr:circadian clock protein KaiC [Dolichospermum sp. ST_sed6]MDD1435419.1 circadian clock protein KaiC [Dolichospermum sp. ST_sed10]MDD1439755.1 circadian clock protein KaiC [Dolichospermum sp. ST_sed3]MDD1445651.1 circadian clock protein KaiC [Dolichospermum sp. ST_sed8]MDD1459753.1 circadian clock protein KaiC [Dolichospermum sp. ST_sed2]MDD1471046.1 circadian clock protein KaiC [Dolichospermum sp. ST_sed4]